MIGLRQTLPLFAAALLASGCSSFGHFAKWAPVRAVKLRADATPDRADAAYAAAAAAISRREYGKALDLLQIARERKPDDVRVLNAFGVVYDKLGRFDLSARYYAQAQALDGGSAIVAHNMAYSEDLRRQASGSVMASVDRVPVTEVASAAAPAAGQRPGAPLQLERPVVLKLGFAAPSAVTQLQPVLLGGPIEVRDASGRVGGAETVVADLRQRGWTSPKITGRDTAIRAHTAIFYPANATATAAARALARTLPGGAQLVECRDACVGVRLIVGADAVGAPPPKRSKI